MPTSEIIKLKNVRLSFPRLFKPRSFRPGQEPRYEATFLLDPSDKAHAAIIEAIEFTADDIAAEMWPKKLPPKLVRCYGLAGDEKPPLEYDGYPDMYFVRTAAKVNAPPLVADRGRNTLEIVDGVEPTIPYAGCVVNASITLWTMDNEFGNRINSNLRIVQFVKDGERFSGIVPPDADEELDILDDEDDGDDFLDD